MKKHEHLPAPIPPVTKTLLCSMGFKMILGYQLNQVKTIEDVCMCAMLRNSFLGKLQHCGKVLCCFPSDLGLIYNFLLLSVEYPIIMRWSNKEYFIQHLSFQSIGLFRFYIFCIKIVYVQTVEYIVCPVLYCNCVCQRRRTNLGSVFKVEMHCMSYLYLVCS